MPIVGVLVLLALASLASGCSSRCVTLLDCASDEYCIQGRDFSMCTMDCATVADCQAQACDELMSCLSKGSACDDRGRCVGPKKFSAPLPPSADKVKPGGWELPPLTDRAISYVFDDFQVAPTEVGFDIDHECPGNSSRPGCVDNALSRLGSAANSSIRNGVLSGSSLVLMQIAGLSSLGSRTATIVTAKLYAGVDTDGRPENNVRSQVPGDPCCQLAIAAGSLHDNQARARAPITVSSSKLSGETYFVSARSSDTLDLFLMFGSSRRTNLVLAAAQISGNNSRGADRVAGILGGALTIASLEQISNSFCTSPAAADLCPSRDPSSSLIEGLANQLQPDIDLDGDGIERFVLSNGRIVECRDGDRSLVPPIKPDEPATCARDPRMADGFSIAFSYTGVRADIVAIR